MKEGWKYKTIGEVSEQISDGDWIEKKDQSTNGIRLIQTGNIGFGKYKDKAENSRFISEETFEKLRCTEIFEGDILISRLPEPLGRSCMLPYSNTRRITAVDCTIVKLDRRIVYPYYFVYFTMSEEYLRKVQEQSSGTTRQRITRKKLEQIEIPLPPLSEQQRIVSQLDSSFAKIDALKTNAGKMLDEAKALFAAALREAMKPKEGWEEKKLGEIAVDSADGPFGSNLKKEHYTSNREVRIIQLSNIGEEGWREENTKYTTFEHLKKINRSAVEPNDIVIAKMMPAGRAILCPNHEKAFVLSSDAVKVKLKDGIDVKFVLNAINSDYYRKQVYDNVSGSGRVRTSLTKLRSYSLFLPPLPEQTRIVSHLDNLSAKVRQLEANFKKVSEECDALKQAILKETFE